MQELTREVLIERLDKLEYTLESMREDVVYHLNMERSRLEIETISIIEEEIARLDILLAIVRGDE